MMRHRAVSAVRVYDRCARCGTTYLANYDVRKVTAFIDGRRHELVVCAACGDNPNEATCMESGAMGCDLTNPVEVMAYMQAHHADPARVLRTAEYFMPDYAFATAREEAQRKFAERRAEQDKYDAERLERVAARYQSTEEFTPHDDEDDDDLPF